MKIIDVNNAIKLCYFKTTKGIYDDSVDATYIIHLLGNIERTNNILFQLQKLKPTKKIYILLNKGYKYKENINNSAEDLVNCNLEIFKHANMQNYNNILILEDDFIWLDDNVKDINKFCNLHKNKEFLFYLGTLPVVFYPYTFKIYKGVFNIMTHSIIYSKIARNKILKYPKKISDIDLFLSLNDFERYFYYYTLCGQTYTKTENSKTWYVYKSFLYDFFFKAVYFFKADIYPAQFFLFWYILFIIILIIIICFVTIITFKINPNTFYKIGKKILNILFTRISTRIFTPFFYNVLSKK